MASDPNSSCSSVESERTVVTHTTILILSALLIGMVLGRMIDPQMATIAYPLGMLGLVAYLGLGHVARHRRDAAEQRERRREVRRTEGRLARHVRATLQEPPRARRNAEVEHAATQQFVPVMRSN